MKINFKQKQSAKYSKEKKKNSATRVCSTEHYCADVDDVLNKNEGHCL